jgi:amino acid permease
MQHLTTVLTDDQHLGVVSWSTVYTVVMFCILIVCFYCCYVLYPDRLFVLLLFFVSWSSLCTVVMFCIFIRIQNITAIQTDDQHAKHNNSTNRGSGYNA